ncbi:hypothetical protein [Corynebacterium tapiri]|uniref:TadE-like protein n=1 Tax=Corynebacterium tapiri TaxID=1448266 RepID=A0A5C4U362_9CORY|nr:hypothetical protein [Corynebacterium tapiri]TNL97347.1 hypothetical protein FHE74_06665 [Corynebacterium tapiri]
MLRDDRGSVTIEAALSLASLVIVAAAIVAAMATLAAKITAVDIAAAAARAHAVGLDYEPPIGTVSIEQDTDFVRVTSSVPGPIKPMEAQAVFPVEVP